MLDTPIVGGVKYARERAVTFLVGGPADSFERVQPVLDALGQSRHVGEFAAGVDEQAHTNVSILAVEAGLREALDLADILGQDYETSLELMSAGPMRAVVDRALDVSNPLRYAARPRTMTRWFLRSMIPPPLETIAPERSLNSVGPGRRSTKPRSHWPTPAELRSLRRCPMLLAGDSRGRCLCQPRRDLPVCWAPRRRRP